MSQQQSSTIEFPCDYSIKVVGDAAPDFREFVISVVERHAPGIDESHVRERDSRNGRFVSVHLQIRATGEDQLKALTEDLKASGRVHMVL